MKNSSKALRRLAAVILAAMMMCMGASAWAASFQAKINSASAKVYKLPSSNSAYVKNGKGVTVTVTGYSGGWARIKYKGNTGYTKISNLDLKNRMKAYTGKTTAVYKQASTSSSRLGTLSIGRAVYVVGKVGDFYRVQNASGSVSGYVKEGNLTTRAKLVAAYKAYKQAQQSTNSGSSAGTSSGSSAGTTTGGASTGSGSNTGFDNAGTTTMDKVIALATKYIGRPYASSDNPPSSFNCSSFVEYCLEAYGYSVPGTSVTQANYGREIKNISDLKKGDILCFDSNEDGVCDHTALYISGNSFIEASENAGKVQKNTLDSWYREHFMFGRRPSK